MSKYVRDNNISVEIKNLIFAGILNLSSKKPNKKKQNEIKKKIFKEFLSLKMIYLIKNFIFKIY